MSYQPKSTIVVNVVGVGGAGGNAVTRMAKNGIFGVDLYAFNTDVQALRLNKDVRTLAIGPKATSGMGSGGQPEIGKKAVKESHAQINDLLQGSDMVFVTAGMGGGTGTGAAASVAEIARKQGALTVGIVTLPFSFEGPKRRAVAEQGLHNLKQKVDTLITIENDRLLPSLDGTVKLEKAFEKADDVLKSGVQGIADIVTQPGLINVDFADVKAIIGNGGTSYMAIGDGRGKFAAIEAAHMALANPLFTAPLDGAKGVLLNVKGGKDLTLGQVHEVAGIIRKATKSHTNVIFGVVQDKKMKKRVSVTVVATGIASPTSNKVGDSTSSEIGSLGKFELGDVIGPALNGKHDGELVTTQRLI